MSIILGTMNINYPFSSNPNANLEEYKQMIEKYIYYVGNKAILDTAYYYGNTSTEKMLGNILPELSILPRIASKVNPWYNNDFTNGHLGQLAKAPLEKQFHTSLKNLGLNSMDYLFLHCYDYETPLEETLEVCNNLWRREKINNLGISNFSMEQLKNVIYICEREGYNLPDVYQGMYNIISRKVEEIFPLLLEYSIEFWAYNPLAGGLLTGKYNDDNNQDNNSRFKDNKIYQNIFWKEPILSHLNTFFEKGNCIENSFYWLKTLSKLRHDGKIIMGASSLNQLDNNMKVILKKRDISDDNIYFLNNLYEPIRNFTPNYYY